jgi:fumarylacetoacetase
MTKLDPTHSPQASSWVAGADSHPDFPVQNLPFGIFSTGCSSPRIGVAIGDFIFDLQATSGRLDLSPEWNDAVRAALLQPTLNTLFELPTDARKALRLAVFELLTDRAQEPIASSHLVAAQHCQMHLPLTVRDFTDFYAGIHHARTVGALLRPENSLLANYKYVPVGYHGRASSVRVSGADVVRPQGQIRPPGSDQPLVSACRRLDYEVELGFWLAGGNQLGTPIPIREARQHIAGVCLLNDWSARDVQAWEYQPLGPFLAKNFATTISPWVVTAEALEPFRRAQPPRPVGDPLPLPYLSNAEDQRTGAFDIQIEVALITERMRREDLPPFRLGSTHASNLYWTVAQMISHHTVNGCNIGAGDLLGTGTISGQDDTARGSLMELSSGGNHPFVLPNGEERTFLEDGDEVIMTGWAERQGLRRIGFGQCRAKIRPANIVT